MSEASRWQRFDIPYPSQLFSRSSYRPSRVINVPASMSYSKMGMGNTGCSVTPRCVTTCTVVTDLLVTLRLLHSVDMADVHRMFDQII